MIFGITEPVLIIAVLVGAMVGTSVNQMRPKRNIPLAEIYLKKGGAIVWFVDAENRWWPHALKKTKNGYFAVYTDRFKGLYHIDSRKKFYMGGSNTPCYAISTKNMNNYNPIEIGKINEFLDKNGIYKLRRKDMNHLRKLKILRQSIGKKKASEKLEQITSNEVPMIDNAINEGLNEAKAQIQKINKEKKTDYVLDGMSAGRYLIDYMLRHDFIDDTEAENLLFKVENEILDLNGVIDEFKDIARVSITETIDTDIDRIVDEFGAENPIELTGIIDDAITNKKELKKMTPVPVKQIIPGGTIIGIAVAAMIFIILISNGTISLDGIGGGGGFLPGFSILSKFLGL